LFADGRSGGSTLRRESLISFIAATAPPARQPDDERTISLCVAC
jgi:hypothetical protein